MLQLQIWDVVTGEGVVVVLEVEGENTSNDGEGEVVPNANRTLTHDIPK